MQTVKQPDNPIMVLNVMSPDMKIMMSTMFYFADVGNAIQRQMNTNLEAIQNDPELGVMYLIVQASDEEVERYEQQLGKPVKDFHGNLEEMVNEHN